MGSRDFLDQLEPAPLIRNTRSALSLSVRLARPAGEPGGGLGRETRRRLATTVPSQSARRNSAVPWNPRPRED